MVAELSRVPGPFLHGCRHPFKADVQRLATALHEPVGVEQQRAAGPHFKSQVVISDVLDPDWIAASVQKPRRVICSSQQWWQVATVGPRNSFPGAIDDRVYD